MRSPVPWKRCRDCGALFLYAPSCYACAGVTSFAGTLADLCATPSPWSARELPPPTIPLEVLRRHAARMIEADRLARLHWAVAVEWQILAHLAERCPNAGEARAAIELRSARSRV